MLVYLYKEQAGKVNEFIKFDFDGSFFRTYLNGNLVDYKEATLGDCVYITPRGQMKPPLVSKAQLPKNRGARIAWALSFIGDDKCAKTEKDFFEMFKTHVSGNSKLRNIQYEYNQGKFGFIIADKASISENKSYALKKRSPILAWVSDDISDEGIDELCRVYSKTRQIYCPIEFLKLKC